MKYVLPNEDSLRKDITPLDHGDPEISGLLKALRTAHKQKGLPYHELAASKVDGHIKYLIKEDGEVIQILDLDTGQELVL